MTPPVGALLAGGRGSRLGGAKALVELRGRPLAAWPLAALLAVLADVVVVAKPRTKLPALGVPVWFEPEDLTHPRVGIVHALRCAGGRSVLVCALDLPLIDAGTVAALAAPGSARARVACAPDGSLQPLLARYAPETLPALERAPCEEPLRTTVAALAPERLQLEGDLLLNVNTPADLERAARALALT